MKIMSVGPLPKGRAQADADADDVIQLLSTATPAEIKAWLDDNVQTVAHARRVLLALMLAIRALRTP